MAFVFLIVISLLDHYCAGGLGDGGDLISITYCHFFSLILVVQGHFVHKVKSDIRPASQFRHIDIIYYGLGL